MAELGHSRLNFQARTNCTQCVVLVRQRCAKNCHHRITQVAIHRTAQSNNDRLHRVEIGLDQAVEIFWIEPSR